MEEMIAIMPECIIPCCDLWPWGTLTEKKMHAYKRMEEQKRISRISVVYNRNSRHTIIEYMSTIPHEWILQAMKEMVQHD